MDARGSQFFQLLSRRLGAPPAGSLLSEFVQFIGVCERLAPLAPEGFQGYVYVGQALLRDKRPFDKRISKRTLGVATSGAGEVPMTLDPIAMKARLPKRDLGNQAIERRLIARLHATRFLAALNELGLTSEASPDQIRAPLVAEGAFVLLQDCNDADVRKVIYGACIDQANLLGMYTGAEREDLANEVADDYISDPADYLIAPPCHESDELWGFVCRTMQNRLRDRFRALEDQHRRGKGQLTGRAELYRRQRGLPEHDPVRGPFKRAVVARLLRTTPKTLSRLEEQRSLQPERIGGSVYYDLDDIERARRILEERRQTKAPEVSDRTHDTESEHDLLESLLDLQLRGATKRSR